MPVSGKVGSASSLNEMEARVVEWFCDGVRVLGLPRSIGEIYGLLFVSPEPLSLDDLTRKLGISKGSASQGLNWLRTVGAARLAEPADRKGSRRTFYEADIELKRLAGGFIREQIQPHLASGSGKLRELEELARGTGDERMRGFYNGRVEKLERWMSRGKLVLPILRKVLGG